MSKQPTLGVILAGGASSRMGAEKALVELQGRPLIKHVYERFAPQVDSIIVSGPQDFGLGVRFIPDSDPEFIGPMGGILSAAVWAEKNLGDDPFLVTVPVDAPLLPRDLVSRLLEKSPSIAATNEKRHPTFANWGRGAARTVKRFLEQSPKRSLLALADFTGAEKIVFPNEAKFLNINTPDDLRLAEKELTGF